MSGAQTSTFGNVLFNPLMAGEQQSQQNALLKQQQDIGATDMAMVGRAGASLLNMSEEKAALAYGPMIQDLQSRGFAKNAPTQYPGHAATQALVQRAMTVPEQYQYGVLTPPGVTEALKAAGVPLPGQGGAAAPGSDGTYPQVTTGVRGPGSATRGEAEGGPPAAGSPGAAVAQRTYDFWKGRGYSDPQIAGIMAGGPGSESDFTPSVYGDNRTSYGLYQHHGPRLDNMRKYFGLAGDAMPSEQQQHEYAAWEISPAGPLAHVGVALAQAKTPEEAATIWTRDFGVPADKTEIGRRARGAGRYAGRYGGATGGAPAAPGTPGVQVGGAEVPAPPGGAPGAAAPTARISLGAALAPPGAAATAPPPPPGQQTSAIDAIQAGRLAAQSATPASAMPMMGGPGAGPEAQPLRPAEPGWGTGQATGYGGGSPTPGTVSPAPVAPVAPAAQPAAPAASAQPSGTGIHSPQFQAAMELNRRAQALDMVVDPTGRTKAMAASLRAQAALYMQADAVSQNPDGTQTKQLTGERLNAAAPNAHYVWNPQQGAYVDTTGVHPPVTPPSPRFSPQTVDPATGKPAVAAIGGEGVIKYFPVPDRPATATYDLQKELHKRDTDALPEYSTQNQTAAANQIRIQQMRELIDSVTTGAGGAARADWANLADTLGWHDLAKRLVGMGGTAAAQEFAKYGLATAGAQERGDLGARGSLGAINLYKSANPGLELQPDANKKMLTAQLIGAQANRDYTQQAMDYVNRNGDAFLRGGTYAPLSHFDADWAAARNPQIYAAAMGAINGDSWEKWTKALNTKSPEDVQRVLDIVRRADPTSTVMWNNGKQHAVGQAQ